MLDLAGKRVTVMGLGRFGGGIGVTRWLCSRGADVLVTDVDPIEELQDSVDQIRPLIDSGQVSLRLGEHSVSDFTTCDLVVANAAVKKPWENRFLRSAEAASIPITTEITLTLQALLAQGVTRTIGITGSAGKSTTTAMIHHALGMSDVRCPLSDVKSPGPQSACTSDISHVTSDIKMGGNIGGSLLTELDSITANTIVVLELSSAMLYWLDRTLTPKWSPHIAVVTNVSANHIDWHGDFDHYAASKKHLIERQTERDTAVLGETVRSWSSNTCARPVFVDPASFHIPLSIPGDHNRFNAAAALAACIAAAPEANPDQLARSIAAFGGLAHRLQLVATHEPKPGAPAIRFYNDSKSTTPESALKAIDALAAIPGFSRSRLHLIAGGYDKGSDLSPIASLVSEIAGLYTIGDTGPAIASASSGRAVECGTVQAAFDAALARLKPGDALLLSPGCASWDQYVNFEERGDEFVRLVHAAVGNTRALETAR